MDSEVRKIPPLSIVTGSGLEIAGREKNAPNAHRLIHALRQIGYSLEQALSDLIDNSINAGCSTVLIRFIHDWQTIRSVVVADNGGGMDADCLTEAMRFGAGEEPGPTSLGKFGMGLKLASLSHAACVTVLTRSGGTECGRRWTVQGAGDDWSSDIIDAEKVGQWFAGNWGGCQITESGTMVIWDAIDKLPASRRGLRWTLRSIQKRLEVHLGMHFHRFIENGRLRILIDQQVVGDREQPVSVAVPALNPFGYSSSGHPEYPRTFDVDLGTVGRFAIEGHIWPPHSQDPAYSLGSRAASRQGFYFYRNDRLIQAGGWNGLVSQDAEPHSSLARISIDLPPELDESFSLNVQKSAVVTPPGFNNAISAAADAHGQTFDLYRRHAEETYRLGEKRSGTNRTPVPGRGLPKKVREKLAGALGAEEGNTAPFDLRWVEDKSGTPVSIDMENDQIRLNRDLQRYVQRGIGDAPSDTVIKTLIFALLESDLKAGTSSRSAQKRLKRLNEVLAAVLQA